MIPLFPGSTMQALDALLWRCVVCGDPAHGRVQRQDLSELVCASEVCQRTVDRELRYRVRARAQS